MDRLIEVIDRLGGVLHVVEEFLDWDAAFPSF